jgi:nitroreductase
MNTNLNPVFSRRSIRKYLSTDVSDQDIKDILEAAMAAPSACATDPWHFIVVRNQDLRENIASFLPNGQMLIDAPVGIVVCGDIEKAHTNKLSYMLQDCSAAIENLLISANILGLGACWLGIHPREDRIKNISELFKLPKNIIPISVISLGYPDEKPSSRTRYNEAAVHFEKW